MRSGSEGPSGASGGPAKPGIGYTNIAHPRPAPKFELPNSQGKIFKLKELQGKPVIVHFWASWCPPCIEEIPAWLEFTTRWKDKGLGFVAVSLDQNWADAHKILPDTRVPAHVISVLDAESTLPDGFGTYQYPETYLLDSQHKIVSKWVGPQDWEHPSILAALTQALSQRKP